MLQQNAKMPKNALPFRSKTDLDRPEWVFMAPSPGFIRQESPVGLHQVVSDAVVHLVSPTPRIIAIWNGKKKRLKPFKTSCFSVLQLLKDWCLNLGGRIGWGNWWHFTIFLSKQAGHRLKKGFGCIWKYVGHQSALNSGLNFINLVLLMFEVLRSHAKNLHSKKWAGNGFWTWSRGRGFGSQIFDTKDVGPTCSISSTSGDSAISKKTSSFASDLFFSRLVKRPNLQISHPIRSDPILGGVHGRVRLWCVQSLRGFGWGHWIQILEVLQLCIRIFLHLFVGILPKSAENATDLGELDELMSDSKKKMGAWSKTILDSPMNLTLWQSNWGPEQEKGVGSGK